MASGSGGGGGAGGWAAGSDRDPTEEKLERSMGPLRRHGARGRRRGLFLLLEFNPDSDFGVHIRGLMIWERTLKHRDAADKPLLVEQITMGEIRKTAYMEH
uniref:Uncharacterized protein n=1 Tax=Oryza sativa subsp. japonica TaxID=39947 RepID=Q2QZS7_ORYSJ|nr:hypothetical protein LOC_Os11g44980 [Oryza sativa Japonica Group]